MSDKYNSFLSWLDGEKGFRLNTTHIDVKVRDRKEKTKVIYSEKE